jgi:teichuronic acid biosynthesis glycosyltransferase TuaC
MHVLIVTNNYPTPELPYSGIFVKQHVEALRKLGVQVDVFFTNGKRTRMAYLTELPNLARRLRSERYDVIHAKHSYCVFQLMFVRPFVGRKAPVVFTVGAGEAFLPDGIRDPQADLLRRFTYSKRLTRWALQQSDCVVSVERRLPPLTGYQGPYEVITRGVNLEIFRPMSTDQCRKELGLPERQSIVFFPASPEKGFIKGFDLVQQALSYLKQPIQLVTAGSIPPERMPHYMNAANVVVQASRFEAAPNVVKEAMACNRPMVCTDVGDVRELFGDVPGLFICARDPKDIAEKIEQALNFDGPIRGRERILELGLSLEQVAHRYLALYERSIGTGETV